MDLLSSLHRLRVDDQGEQKSLDAHLSLSLTLEQKRNEVTHSRWGQNAEQVVRWKTTARKKKGLDDQFTKMTSAELHSLANNLAQLNSDIMDYMFESKWIQDNAMITIDLSNQQSAP